jgi:ribosomal protein L21
VQEGSLLNVPSIDAEPGSSIELRDVLLVSDDGNVTVGNPSVDGAVVLAEVVEHGKGKKVVSFKYKAKVRYRRKRGHRQGYTRLSVTSISFGGKTATKSSTAPAGVAAPAEEAPAPARRRRGAAQEAPAQEAPVAETPARTARATRLIEIEGIGETFAKTLGDAEVHTTADLLETAGSRAGRDALAEKTGLTTSQILEWVNRADLMRINGVGSEFSDLLEAAGVDTVKELATRNAANLQAKLAEVNEEKKLTRRTPSESEVEAWVEEAKTLPPAVTH